MDWGPCSFFNFAKISVWEIKCSNSIFSKLMFVILFIVLLHGIVRKPSIEIEKVMSIVTYRFYLYKFAKFFPNSCLLSILKNFSLPKSSAVTVFYQKQCLSLCMLLHSIVTKPSVGLERILLLIIAYVFVEVILGLGARVVQPFCVQTSMHFFPCFWSRCK